MEFFIGERIEIPMAKTRQLLERQPWKEIIFTIRIVYIHSSVLVDVVADQ